MVTSEFYSELCSVTESTSLLFKFEMRSREIYLQLLGKFRLLSVFLGVFRHHMYTLLMNSLSSKVSCTTWPKVRHEKPLMNLWISNTFMFFVFLFSRESTPLASMECVDPTQRVKLWKISEKPYTLWGEIWSIWEMFSEPLKPETWLSWGLSASETQS